MKYLFILLFLACVYIYAVKPGASQIENQLTDHFASALKAGNRDATRECVKKGLTNVDLETQQAWASAILDNGGNFEAEGPKAMQELQAYMYFFESTSRCVISNRSSFY